MLLTIVTDDVPAYLVIPKANHLNKLEALIVRSYQSNVPFIWDPTASGKWIGLFSHFHKSEKYRAVTACTGHCNLLVPDKPEPCQEAAIAL